MPVNVNLPDGANLELRDGATGADKTPSIMNGLSVGGYPAIGDFNKDGAPDVVFVQSQNNNQQVAVVDVKNNKFLMNPTAVRTMGSWMPMLSSTRAATPSCSRTSPRRMCSVPM